MHKLERDFYLALCTLFTSILLVTCVYYMSRVKRLEAKLSDANKKNEFIIYLRLVLQFFQKDKRLCYASHPDIPYIDIFRRYRCP